LKDAPDVVLEPLCEGMDVLVGEQGHQVSGLGWEAANNLDGGLRLEDAGDLVTRHEHGNGAFTAHHPRCQPLLSMGVGAIHLVED